MDGAEQHDKDGDKAIDSFHSLDFKTRQDS
jgi:hypothetical protein